MKILLDSCSFLWITGDSTRLSKKAVEAFRNPSNDVFLSAVSVWEISLKYALGMTILTPDTHIRKYDVRTLW